MMLALFCAVPRVWAMNDPLEDTDIDDFLPKRMDKQYLQEEANEQKEMMPAKEEEQGSWSPEEEDLSDEALAEYGDYPEEDEYMYEEEEYPEDEMMPEEEFDEENEYWYPENEEKELPEQNEVEEVEEMMPQGEVNERDVRMM